MPKSKNKRWYLEPAAKIPPPTTHFIDPNVARQLQIVYGFKNLDLNKKPFDCTSGQGKSLLYVLNSLRLFSNVARDTLERDYPKCHSIPDNLIKKHNLFSFLTLSPNGKLHQLGRRQTPERVIGYFDAPHINLFQICLLDLKHELSGD